MNIPTPQDCCRLHRQMKTMDHIVAHSLQVCRVAMRLVENLLPANPGLNADLVRAAALLHDITKTRSFSTGENHAETGAAFLQGIGCPEVAFIVGQHVRLDAYGAIAAVGEAEIVNYSDKRVLHDRIVPLTDRMGYIFDRYGWSDESRERIRWLWKKTEHLEERIFSGLAFGPDDLAAALDDAGLAAAIAEFYRTRDESRGFEEVAPLAGSL